RDVSVVQFTEAAMNPADIMDNNGGHIDNAYEEVVTSGEPSADVEAMSGASMRRRYDNAVTARNALHEKHESSPSPYSHPRPRSVVSGDFCVRMCRRFRP